jgi:hypothetical protein
LTSANAYFEGRYYVGGTSSLAAGNSNASQSTLWTLNRIGTWTGHIIMDIANPQASEVTTATTMTTGGYFQILGQSLNNNTNSYDGFTFYTSALMTGSVSVYGYSK